jgi:hypothetical protein
MGQLEFLAEIEPIGWRPVLNFQEFLFEQENAIGL